jgi:DNA-binding CsgD family transcriptional regulator
MPQQGRRFGEAAERIDSSAVALDAELAASSAARTRAFDQAGVAIAQQLNGPLTALLLYMGEIKQHSHLLALSAGDQVYLQTIVQNALQQTERVCALVKQIAGACEPDVEASADNVERRAMCFVHPGRAARAKPPREAGHKALTRRERQVLQLISEGYSNKEGALRMQISPRTFESHRAEAMRKLGARNTADLVRAALLQRLD